jgi:hypothetical protein
LTLTRKYHQVRVGVDVTVCPAAAEDRRVFGLPVSRL